uniref:Uncharacterized protein n=1 Tax=Romanomermis culicivorax TaxID=13658 RepID=A0A915JZZ7_ROMCU
MCQAAMARCFDVSKECQLSRFLPGSGDYVKNGWASTASSADEFSRILGSELNCKFGVSHTHDAGASAKQAPSHATPSHPANCNCQQPNFATDNDLQGQPWDLQVIDSITDTCALELENFRCEARD